jgi:hypothetical protein
MAVIRQPNEVFSLIFDPSVGAIRCTGVAAGTGPTNTIYQVNEVLSNAYSAGTVNALQVSTVAPSGSVGPSGVLMQPNEVFRHVYDPSSQSIRVAKVSTGGGPVAGYKHQVNEILSGSYDATAKALRVVSVGAGSGPVNVLRQPNEVLNLIYDPVAGAIQEEGV